MRIKSATQLQVWWKLIVVLQKIRVRTANNVAAKQERSARTIEVDSVENNLTVVIRQQTEQLTNKNTELEQIKTQMILS